MRFYKIFLVVLCFSLTACSTDTPSEEKIYYDLSIWLSNYTDNAVLVDDMVVHNENQIHEELKMYHVSFYPAKNPEHKGYVGAVAKSYFRKEGSIKYSIYYEKNSDGWAFSKLTKAR